MPDEIDPLTPPQSSGYYGQQPVIPSPVAQPIAIHPYYINGNIVLLDAPSTDLAANTVLIDTTSHGVLCEASDSTAAFPKFFMLPKGGQAIGDSVDFREVAIADQDGVFSMDITLVDAGDLIPDHGDLVLTTGNRAAVGDGRSIGGRSLLYGDELVPLPPNVFVIETLNRGKTTEFTFKSSTGYVAVKWFDGTSSIYGIGDSESNISLLKAAIAVDSPHAGADVMRSVIWSCSSLTDYTQSGTLTAVQITSTPIFYNYIHSFAYTDTGISNLSAYAHYLPVIKGLSLDWFYSENCLSTHITFIDTVLLPGSTFQLVNAPNLVQLNLGGIHPDVNTLTIYNTGLTDINTLLESLPRLSYFRSSETGFIGDLDLSSSSIRALTISDAKISSMVIPAVMSQLDLQNSELEHLDLSLGINMALVDIAGNKLSSVVLGDFAGYISSYSYSLDMSNQNMTTDAVYDMLDSVTTPAQETGYPIILIGCPCDAGDGNLLEDGVHTQAEIMALLTSTGYALHLTGATLAP
jgi:hypothetical protein